MHILILNWRDVKNEWGGGAELYVHELAKRWVNAGHQVTLFCGQNYLKNLAFKESYDGVQVVRRGGRYTLYLWAAWYYFTVFRHRTDVIVDAINGVPFFTPLYARKPIVALLFHIHDIQFFTELPFPANMIGFLIEKYALPLFYSRRPVVAISNTTKRDATQLGFPQENISVIYPGLTFMSSDHRRPQKRYSVPTILYLGKIKRYKRVDYLIKFMPAILAKVPTARLLIAGWGSDGPYLTDLSMKSAIKKRVKILGPVSEAEKKTLMARAWVCANPSLHEGWGIPVIEANFFGTPTVAFNVPGLSESILAGRTGLLAETDAEFISHLVRLLKNQKLRSSMSKNCIRWAQKFNWDRLASQFLHVVKQTYAKG